MDSDLETPQGLPRRHGLGVVGNALLAEEPQSSIHLVRATASREEAAKQPRAERPPSATALPTALVGLAAAIAAMLLFADAAWALHLKVLAVVMATAMAMMAVDLFWFRTSGNPENGLAPGPVNAWSANRLLRKLIGFAATLGALYAAYSAFAEYSGSFYDPAWRATRACLPFLLIATPFYIAWIDRRQRDPEDAYAQLGGLLTAQGVPGDWMPLAQHARGWLVKGFFLPLMFVYLAGSLEDLWRTDFAVAASSFLAFYEFSYAATILFDLLFAVVGYFFTLRLLDTHIRSAEPTMTGWVVCLLCYQPFWSLIERGYLTYESDSFYWDSIASVHPILYWGWGIAILLCMLVYTLSTIVFGLRFSNLTHRGIITSGPYRWTKHPAYISKCASFWLISIPFLSHAGAGAAVTQTVLLLAANGLYVARAITEERHLARDPVYRAYQAYIREHGLFAQLRRASPAAPVDKILDNVARGGQALN